MSFVRKYLFFLCALVAAWLTIRYALPVLLPFLLGALLALAAEPAVHFSTRRLHLPRWAGAGLGVSLTLIVLVGLFWLFGSAVIREMGVLAQALPDLQDTARQGIDLLKNTVVTLSEKMPANLGGFLSDAAASVAGSSSTLMEQTVLRLPGLLTSAVGKMSQGLIGLGTGLISAFLISARLPRLRQSLSAMIPASWRERFFPALSRIRRTLGGWLKAQSLLLLVTYAIVCVGFLLLRIPYGPIWAVLIALVDAVPMLGTGTVLLPWALVSLLQGSGLQALGLVGIFLLATVSRSALEPRLLGKHIGLDPLITLLAMYAGYRFFGFWGLILAPISAAAVKAAASG